MGSSPSFLDPVVLSLFRGSSILDAACGFGRWGCLLRTNYFEFGLSTPPTVDGFDAFEPNVQHARQLTVYRDVWVATLPCKLPRGKYSTILASELIEHLPLETINSSLDEFEAAATERVILTTPNCECLREGSETFSGYNEYDAHVSFVSRRQLRSRGYKIVGAGFGNPQTVSARIVGKCLSLLGVRDTSSFESLTKHLPSLAHTIVAYKDV